MEQWAHTRLQAFKTFIHKFGKEDAARLIEECRNTLNETLGCDISEHDLLPINYNFQDGKMKVADGCVQDSNLMVNQPEAQNGNQNNAGGSEGGDGENNGNSNANPTNQLLSTDKRVLPLRVTKYPSQARYRWRQSRVKNFKSFAQRFGEKNAINLLNEYIVQLNSIQVNLDNIIMIPKNKQENNTNNNSSNNNSSQNLNINLNSNNQQSSSSTTTTTINASSLANSIGDKSLKFLFDLKVRF